MEINQRVRYSREFLWHTYQYTGPAAPCNYGPHARGTVKAIGAAKPRLVTVLWDNEQAKTVLENNLEAEDG